MARYRVYGYRTAEDDVYLDVEADSPALAIAAAKAEVEESEDRLVSTSIAVSEVAWDQAEHLDPLAQEGDDA